MVPAIIVPNAALVSLVAILSALDQASVPVGRQSVNLNAGWQFRKGALELPADQPSRHSDWQSVNLPHTWNNQDGQDGGNDYYRGPASYRRTFAVPQEARAKHVFLRFGAASTIADVYVNGQHAGRHRGAYTAFCFDITGMLQFGGENQFAVQVDNGRHEDVPPWSADFTFFGGIYRDVELLFTSPVHITPLDHASPGVYVSQTQVTDAQARIEVIACIANATPQAREVTVAVVVWDAAEQVVARAQQPARIAAGAGQRVGQQLIINQPRLWNGKADPWLYEATVELVADGAAVDTVRQTFGLRYFQVDPERGLLLNGQPLDLHGVNRHQDWQDLGWAISRAEHERDLALILELGCTGVRLAHYPHDPYFYSLCDRAGLIVWAEIPLVNRVFATPEFQSSCRQQLIELIRQNYNHPAIFFWGLHNEITAPWEPGPDATALIAELSALAKAEDPTRLTVCAATIPDDHAANWQTDLVAFNRYYGWYDGAPDEFAAWADRVHQAHPERPMGISEYGAGASIWHHEHPVGRPVHDSRWHPEEWQAYVHERHWRAMRQRPYLWCKFVWNMFDFASDGRAEGDRLGRNDKGLVTYDRATRKDAFYYYKSQWSQEPFVHIAGRRHVERSKTSASIRVYSNCPEVTLFVNDKSLGARRQSDGAELIWTDVPLAPGSNRIQAESGAGAARVVDQCVWVVCPSP